MSLHRLTWRYPDPLAPSLKETCSEIDSSRYSSALSLSRVFGKCKSG